LPTVPEFPGQSLELTSCPTVPEAIKIVRELYTWPIRLLHVYVQARLADMLEWSELVPKKVEQVAVGLETL